MKIAAAAPAQNLDAIDMYRSEPGHSQYFEIVWKKRDKIFAVERDQ